MSAAPNMRALGASGVAAAGSTVNGGVAGVHRGAVERCAGSVFGVPEAGCSGDADFCSSIRIRGPAPSAATGLSQGQPQGAGGLTGV
jgi:hypothetical protein